MSDANREQSTGLPESKFAITRDQYDAVLLDLDGVITVSVRSEPACEVWRGGLR
jgi:hypothetical protein